MTDVKERKYSQLKISFESRIDTDSNSQFPVNLQKKRN